MLRQYHCGLLTRSNSVIELNDDSTCAAIARPSAGFTADTRFFGRGKNKLFVVKRPKYSKYQTDTEIKMIDHAQEASYRQEQTIWNHVYPNNKAYLSTDGGLRLVLPCLPGKTLTNHLSDNDYTRCLQLLSVAYAIKRFHQLGYTYADFNTDNVLIDEVEPGVFQAYLIDFGSIDKIHLHVGGIQEIAMITRLIPGCDWKTQHASCDQLIQTLQERLNLLTREITSPMPYRARYVKI